MGNINMKVAICHLLLSTMVVGQAVVTVSIGTCLSGPAGPEASAPPGGPSVVPNSPEPNTSVTALSAPSASPTGFLLSYEAPGNSPVVRRDVEKYPTLDGRSTSACVDSPLYSVDGAGQLSVVNAGTFMIYSTSAGESSELFAPSANVGSISTTWSLAAGILLWKNSVFSNGTASLCSDSTGAIQAYFLVTPPANCTAIFLKPAPVSSCPGYNQVNPNGLLASFMPSSSLPSGNLSSSTSVLSSQSTASSSLGISSAGLSSTTSMTTTSITSQSSGHSSSNSSSPSIASSFATASFAGNGNFTSSLPSETASTIAFPFSLDSSYSLPGPSVPSTSAKATNGSSSPSLPGFSIIPISSGSISSSLSSFSGFLPSYPIPTVPAPVQTTPASVATSPALPPTSLTAGPSSSSIIPPSSAPFVQVTITSTVTSGSSLYTTYLDTSSSTVIEEIVQPSHLATTIYSGSSYYTTSTTLPNGQQEVEIIAPATTTKTSYTATTTLYTTTTTGSGGQVTVLVVSPTPGMQFFGFEDPQDYGSAQEPNAARFNNDAANINAKGVFPSNVNFQTDPTGGYTFPNHSAATNVSSYAVVLEGYFHGPEGNYSVTLSLATDDYGFLWADTAAYAGWANSDADVTESIAGGYTQNHSFFLAAGEFLPVTILWVNVYQFGALDLVIYPPYGGVTNDTTGYFVQPYSGDGFVYHV